MNKTSLSIVYQQKSAVLLGNFYDFLEGLPVFEFYNGKVVAFGKVRPYGRTLAVDMMPF